MDIKIVDLFKSYDNKTVIKSINLELLSGEIYCLVGKNGAGKSTLFNIIAGLVNQDKGKIKFDNKSYKNIPNKVKRHIGFKGDVSSLIEELTAFQYLKLIGLFYRVNKTDLNLRIPQIIDYFFEEDKLHSKKISTFSTGMKKRLEICSCLIHLPDFLILDEPFNGLDVVYSEKLIEFLKQYKSKFKTILISSHNFDYVERLDPNLLFLDDNTIKYKGTISNFLNNSNLSFHDNLLESLKFKKEKSDITWM
jgi:ABC-type multidrug transport system ATPase subunit